MHTNKHFDAVIRVLNLHEDAITALSMLWNFAVSPIYSHALTSFQRCVRKPYWTSQCWRLQYVPLWCKGTFQACILTCQISGQSICDEQTGCTTFPFPDMFSLGLVFSACLSPISPSLASITPIEHHSGIPIDGIDEIDANLAVKISSCCVVMEADTLSKAQDLLIRSKFKASIDTCLVAFNKVKQPSEESAKLCIVLLQALYEAGRWDLIC